MVNMRMMMPPAARIIPKGRIGANMSATQNSEDASLNVVTMAISGGSTARSSSSCVCALSNACHFFP